MNTVQNDGTPIRYTFRLANQDDLPHIVRYFQNPDRPWTVFERTEAAFKTAIDNDLMWLLTDPAGNINTTAAVHILSGGMNIGSTVAASPSAQSQPMSLEMNFAEIGSIWRHGDAPAGFCLDLIYSACILQTYLKANELLISALVTQVVAKNQVGIKKLLQLRQGWESFTLNPECTHQFKQTIADPQSREVELSSFYTPAGISILGAAQCLLGSKKDSKFSSVPRKPCVLQALDRKSNKIVEIDLSATRLIYAAQDIVSIAQSQRLRGLIKKTQTPWYAVERQLNSSFLQPHRGQLSYRQNPSSVFDVRAVNG